MNACDCVCHRFSGKAPGGRGVDGEVRKHYFRRPRQAERLASAVCRLPARGLASAQLVTVLGGPRPSDRRAPQLQNGKKRPLENGLTPPSFRANGNGPRDTDWQVHNFWVRSEAIGPQTGKDNLWLCSEPPGPVV